jgi:TolB protein
MLSRLFILTERVARLAVRGGAWLGNQWLESATNLSHGFSPGRRASRSSRLGDSESTQGRVRSLSGLIIGLLAAVVLLLLWATNPRTATSPVINFFNLTTPIAPEPPAIFSAPNATPLPNPLRSGGAVAFTMRVNGQDDIYAIAIGETQPTRLTSHPADDRNPAWSPAGEKLAFASHRDGNWELYVLDLPTGEITRLTFDLAYQAAPSWSPDGMWLAYEGYQDGNLDIYIIRVDGSEGPFRLTFDPSPDSDPAWSTAEAGREIAYVSWRDGNKEIYLLSLDDPREDTARNVTNTPDLNEEHPAWSPGGLLLAYSAELEGSSLIYAKPIGDLSSDPVTVGQGHNPDWSPDGESLIYTARQGGRSYLLAGQFQNLGIAEEAVGLSGLADGPVWSAAGLPQQLRGSIQEATDAPVRPLYEENLLPPGNQDAPYRLINLEGVDAPVPYLSDRVDDSFVTLRERVALEAGWDVLGRADHVWWDLDRPVDPGQDPQNWHMAGRSFDVVQGYIEGQTPLIQLVMEPQGIDIYWRLYVRAAEQDGSLGEPIPDQVWDFTARWSGDVIAYDRGGKPLDQIPEGYYVDFTLLAEDYGWVRTPSHSSWRSNWPGVLFWQYEKHDGLEWQDAMLEVYPEEELLHAFSTPAPAPTIIPTATPFPGFSDDDTSE